MKLHMPKENLSYRGWERPRLAGGGSGSEAVNKGFEPSRHHVKITVKY